jgi:hypothetical protein
VRIYAALIQVKGSRRGAREHDHTFTFNHERTTPPTQMKLAGLTLVNAFGWVEDNLMTKTSVWMAATALATTLIIPLAAGAEEQKPGAPAAAPHAAPHAAPAAAPRAPAAAPHFSAPAAHVSAPSAAPHFAPHVAAPAHVAPQPQRAAVPHFTPQRAATQHVTPRQESARHIERSNSVSRTTSRATSRNSAVTKRNAATAGKSNATTATSQALSPAAQRRADRAELRHENRVLRSLPASQRAAKREEFRQDRLNAKANAQTQQNATVQSRTRSSALAQQRNARRNGGTALTTQAARQGRFASRFANAQAGNRAFASADPTFARNAWHHHHRAAFVAWFGPVFWPYAYSDVFNYAFWPAGYDDGYWDYVYDDFFDGLFWGQAGPPADYVYAEPDASGVASRAPASVTYASVQQLCSQPGSGVTAWPFADIEKKVGLNADQKSLLDQLRTAANNASAAFKASCPSENAFPLTPPGRLTAMTTRLDATLQSVKTVRPALEAFYNSLSDEQKERFNEIGPSTQVARAGAETTGSTAQDGASCKQPKPGLANLPIDKIEDVVKPTDAQEDGLNNLQAATEKAVSIMQAACPDETPLTPTGRLDAMEKRLQAMVDAANEVKPSLTSFYASLSSEQKARFNRIGQELAGSNG